MNTPCRRLVTLVVTLIAATSIAACGSGAIGPCKSFMWSVNDTEIVKLLKVDRNAMLRSMRVTIHQQPPFYTGAVPFSYEGRIYDVVPPGVAMGHGGLVIETRSGDLQNLFIYPDSTGEKLSGMATGAMTLVGERVVAEGKLLSRDQSTFEIDEVQYDSGGCPVFRSRSSFAPVTGFKQRELETNGEKIAEYYYLWPARSQ